MVKECDDFIYDNQTMSDFGLMSVNFDDDTTLPSALTRTMEKGELNKFKTDVSGYGTSYTEVLTFDIHLMKSDAMYDSNNLPFTAEEYEELVTWLTSPQNYLWITFISASGADDIKCKGYFSNVVPFDVSGTPYGLKCTFECSSPFTYVDKKSTIQSSGYTDFTVSNTSSEKYDYAYVTVKVSPKSTQDIFIHNTSDSKTIQAGSIKIESSNYATLLHLVSEINTYASKNMMTVTYLYNEEKYKTICDATALTFYLTDQFGVKGKYAAYYLPNGNYMIFRGGFFYCKTLADLPMTIDCKNLRITDDLERPVLFSKIGIQDEDEIYWIRLRYGKNICKIFAVGTIEFNWFEVRKGGMIQN